MILEFLKQMDYSIFHFINNTISNQTLDSIMLFLRNAHNWIPLYILLFIYLIYSYKWNGLKYGLYILIAFAIADSITFQLLKPWFGRLRPCHSETLTVRLLLNHCGGKYGFPSNHAANHAAIAISIVLAGIFKKKWINYLWLFWAFMIGIAQIYVGVHYPSDILAGFILGASIAYFNYYAILPLLSRLPIIIKGIIPKKNSNNNCL